MEVWELSAREAIRELVASYAHCADTGRFDDLAALFAPDGVLDVRGEHGATLHGRDAIHAFLTGVGADLVGETSVPIIRHHVSNLTIAVASPQAATGACYFLAVTEHGVDHWGRYRDTYACLDDTWRFAHRTARTDGTTEGGWAATRVGRRYWSTPLRDDHVRLPRETPYGTAPRSVSSRGGQVQKTFLSP